MANNQSERREWSELPRELVCIISKKMTDIFDYISFRMVCKPWRSSTTPTNFTQQMPWLLLPYDPEVTSRSFFSLSNKKSFTMDLPNSLRKALYGSPGGWLIMMDKVFSVSLLNPITGAYIQLPEVTDLPDFRTFHFERVEEGYLYHRNTGKSGMVNLDMISHMFLCNVFSSPNLPFPDSCIVTITSYLSPRFLRIRLGESGDTKWRLVDSTLPCGIDNLMRYNDKFFIVGIDRSTVICDVYPEPQAELVPSLKVPVDFHNCYFGILEGHLLLVTNCLEEQLEELAENEIHMTEKENIDIFQLETNGEMKWMNTNKIGSTTLLLNDNRLITVPRGSFGCGGDYIYFHVRHTLMESKQHKMEVLQMEETGSTPLLSHLVADSESLDPVWLTPSFR